LPRSFAIIPAAGLSVRMGQPKLLLPVAGQPLILQVLAAWKQSRVDQIVVVVRPDDGALAEVVRAAGVKVVIPPSAPPDMKASLICGLAHIAAMHQPNANDCWLVAPADLPGLSPLIINRLIDEAAAHPGQVFVPTIGGRRGHPALLLWSLAGNVAPLAVNEGLSVLIDRHSPQFVVCDDLAPDPSQPFADIDTPEDLHAFSKQASPRTN
jgi:molybdenum cofactor cytidylyltransferase